MERKDVIKDNRTGKIYSDSGIIGNFEIVVEMEYDLGTSSGKTSGNH